MTENYYAILQCDENATHAQLKQSYQKLIKYHHPDKQNGITSDTYRQIDEAWRVLRNQSTRREYDAKLIDDSNSFIIYARLNQNELKFNVENQTYSYDCRCGGVYLIDNMIDDNCLVSCDQCSLVIIINK